MVAGGLMLACWTPERAVQPNWLGGRVTLGRRSLALRVGWPWRGRGGSHINTLAVFASPTRDKSGHIEHAQTWEVQGRQSAGTISSYKCLVKGGSWGGGNLFYQGERFSMWIAPYFLYRDKLTPLFFYSFGRYRRQQIINTQRQHINWQFASWSRILLRTCWEKWSCSETPIGELCFSVFSAESAIFK